MKPLKHVHKTGPAGEQELRRGTPLSDADLVCATRRGDKQAFVEIVARNQAMVCGIALGIVGDFAASEDAAQEAFLTAWRKIHELREPESLRAWLRQIARHAALGYHRRQRGHDTLEHAPDMPDLSPGPDERTASEEEAALVRDALTQLPEIYREPLILYYRENQSGRAVAEALDISEDTVRQRLARGRELLRDQVSGLIEGVLTRTGPTTVFTMTVAVAIGALASPAAVAGGVFTAAASGAVSPTATPASLLKALTASKGSLFLAAMVTAICVPVGYHFRAKSESSRVAAIVVEESARAAQPKTPPSFESRAIFAEWKRLHDTHGTNVEAMPNIYREITGFKDSIHRQGFRAALMAEWVQLNPTNAMAGFRDRTIDASQRRQFIEEWLARDAVAAVNVFKKGGRSWEATVRNSLPELARRAPERVASIVAKLPRPDSSRDSQVHDAFAIVAERGIDFARAAAEGMEGPNRNQALAGVAQTWGKRDLEGAITWAKQLPDGMDRDEVIRSALVGSAASDPVLALERVNLVPPGGRKGYFASTTGARVLQAAAAVDFDVAVGWVAAHPGRLSDEDLMGLASAVGEKLNADPAGFLAQYATAGSLTAILPAITNALVKESSGQRRAVWAWLKGQPEDSATRELRRQVLSTAGEQDTAMAFRLADDAPRTTEGNAQLGLLADGLLCHGTGLHRLERLLEVAPERLRQPLAQSAFNHLSPETLDDPQRWMALLSRLPDTVRVRATESLARAWAEQRPEDAISWAASMPTGETRVVAVTAIASTWAAKDSPAASVWIAGMPPGADRDRSAQSLVFAMAEEFPREAWEWAVNIDDTEIRILAASHAAKMMSARDFATARSWIENGPFTLEAKATIQAALESTSGMTP
jgi:RNA polymerase sigma factor (sigma-70 family)